MLSPGTFGSSRCETRVTLALFEVGTAAKYAAKRQGGDKHQTENASFGWRMQYQALDRERQNHSLRLTRPRRASPSGTSERSSNLPTPVSRVWVSQDLTGVTERLQINERRFR